MATTKKDSKGNEYIAPPVDNQQVKEFADNIRNLKEQIAQLNADVAGQYRLAKDSGIDKGALKEAIGVVKAPKGEEYRHRVNMYLRAINGTQQSDFYFMKDA